MEEKEPFYAEHRIVEPTGEGAVVVQAYIRGIAQSLLPELDWQNIPFEFYIADTPEPNAYIIPSYNPPRIVVSKELIDFFAYKDEAAMVVGHEIGHKDFRNKYAVRANSNPEELSADEFALRKMATAPQPYSWRGAISFFQRLTAKREELKKQRGDKQDALLDAIIQSMDVHLADDDRIKFFTTIAGKSSLSDGTPLPNPPLQDFPQHIKDIAKGLRHISIYEGICPLEEFKTRSVDEQFATLESFIRHPVFSHGYANVLKEFGQYVGAMQIDRQQSAQLEKIHGLARLSFDALANPQHQGAVYGYFLEHVPQDTRRFGKPALGYFADLDIAINKFVLATDADSAEQAAAKIVALEAKLHCHFSDRYSEREFDDPFIHKTEIGNKTSLASFNDLVAHQIRQGGGVAAEDANDANSPHIPFLEYIDSEHPSVAKALWLLGVNLDKKLWERLDDDGLTAMADCRPIRYMPLNWLHLTAPSKEFGYNINGKAVFDPNNVLTAIVAFINQRQHGSTIPFRAAEEIWQEYCSRNNSVLRYHMGNEDVQAEFTRQLASELKSDPSPELIARAQAFFVELKETELLPVV